MRIQPRLPSKFMRKVAGALKKRSFRHFSYQTETWKSLEQLFGPEVPLGVLLPDLTPTSDGRKSAVRYPANRGVFEPQTGHVLKG